MTNRVFTSTYRLFRCGRSCNFGSRFRWRKRRLNLLFDSGRIAIKGSVPLRMSFRFLQCSSKRGIGHLSSYAMMDQCSFIMAHGRELRVYRRLPICSVGPKRGRDMPFGRTRTCGPIGMSWFADILQFRREMTEAEITYLNPKSHQWFVSAV